MPAGRYALLDGHGNARGFEDFRCAPGPMGWRYYADTQVLGGGSGVVDVSVDASWLPVRVRIEGGEHGLALAARGDRLAGTIDGEPLEIPRRPGVALVHPSPAFWAIAARAGGGDLVTVDLDPSTLRPAEGRLLLEHDHDEPVDTPAGRFAAERWTVSHEAGAPRAMWVTGDVVLRLDGAIELTAVEPGSRGPHPL